MVDLQPTIIIVADPLSTQRGYSLLGREFEIKGAQPVLMEVKTLDGVILQDQHYRVSLAEYLRVVPEASTHNWDDNYVAIPVYVAKRSFRPVYIKSKQIDL